MALQEWIEMIQFQKRMWVETTDEGDMPPTIFAFRNGKCLCILTAPQVDRDAGLKGAHMCRNMLGADQIIAVFDAHVRVVEKEEDHDKFLEDYKHGDMQRACDEDGACETGEISDCLSCHLINDKLEGEVQMMPYFYHGKGGVPFEWRDHKGVGEKAQTPNDEGIRFEGIIPDSLKQIMSVTPRIADMNLQKVADACGLTPERQQFHTDRAVFQIMDSQGYICQIDSKYMEEPEDDESAGKDNSMQSG